ncbi:hypothetical protein SAMN05421493_11198 [Pseudobutyrivibrio sp. 49]|nr:MULTISPECIES: hypothetical protein [unclassified Pseudobutyrivibrio]SDI32181.1 hypothetical protein SAMN05421493_11198 [Pseudobutyrivibrio sp. 49]SFN82557.1 hypothetical protein SAMN04487831_10411 [Pseudobutyrivibrio sp. UC1225]
MLATLFNADNYKYLNPDVVAAYRHYSTTGIAEKRDITTLQKAAAENNIV